MRRGGFSRTGRNAVVFRSIENQSSEARSDFLLIFSFAGEISAGAEWVKNEGIDERITARV